MLVGILGMLVPPQIVKYFVDTQSYIENSEDIKLNSYQYLGKEAGVDYGFSERKDVLTIKSNDSYYDLTYYRKNKNDYYSFSSDTYELKKGSPLFIRVNKSEMQTHKGNDKDPIPVLNFSFDGEKYVWDEEKYQYNVKTYYIREKILHTQSYATLLEVLMVIGLILGFPTMITPKSKSKRTRL